MSTENHCLSEIIINLFDIKSDSMLFSVSKTFVMLSGVEA